MHDPYCLSFSSEDDRAMVGVSRRTWARWRRGQARIPHAVLALIRILVHGELPQGGKNWEGWRFYKGNLISPEGHGYAPGNIRALPYLHALIAELQRCVCQCSTEYQKKKSNIIPFPVRRAQR